MAVVLESSDGVRFEVEEAVALQFQMVNWGDVNVIRNVNVNVIRNVNGVILRKVVEYCQMHVPGRVVGEELQSWDEDFVRVDNNTLFALIKAAKYLDIQSLLDLTTQTVADRIMGMNAEEIRQFFNVEEMAPEEAEEVRRMHPWAFD